MLCIFGFGFHDWLCPCELVNVNSSDLEKIICSKCESKFRSEYKSFLADENVIIDWEGNFGDFLGVHIDARLQSIAMGFGNCEHGLTEVQYAKAAQRLIAIFNRCMSDESEKRVAMVCLQNSDY